MIKVDNLVKYFGNTKALDNISFKVHQGEILGFLGPNGAGKTTTMRILTGYMAPSTGKVIIDEKSIRNNQMEVKAKIGYLPENNPLYNDLKVWENLKFFAKIKGISPENVNKKIREIIEVCGLKEVINKNISNLSKGFRQRVGLAQAMLNDPEILILDEPTSGLDPNQIVEIRNLIKRIGEKRTVIISTHILSEVQATCSRIIIINKGKIVAEGSPDELRKREEGVSQIEVSILGNKEEVLNTFSSEEAVKEAKFVNDVGGGVLTYRLLFKEGRVDNPNIFVFDTVVKNSWKIIEMSERKKSLEDAFRSLTK